MKTSADIRNDFLEFFRSKGHAVVASSSLVPGNDPTLLFTNAGMVQFKDVFLGGEKRSYTRAATSQRCLRAGGKHNDLDSVGYTARHHTFFEMLGNFSFGDYFKKDAIAFAWELLTGVWKIPADKLLVTIYHNDDEAFDVWHRDIGLPVDRIIRIGDNKGAPYASDNFWQMADTGPCGPCSEIFYDHGADIPGGPPGSPDEDGDRFIEIWNNVFMQFDRQPDGTLVPLPAPCVDTGMGLERISAVLQHVHSNYEIDLFQSLIRTAADLTSTDDLENKSLRVIADHIRACSFLIVDGVLPSNEGRGYVLRRIIRRALRHGWMLGVRGGFFHRMVAPLVALMGEAYPELAARQDFVERALKAEEDRFAETLDSGMKIFESKASLSARVEASKEAEGYQYVMGPISSPSSSGVKHFNLKFKRDDGAYTQSVIVVPEALDAKEVVKHAASMPSVSGVDGLLVVSDTDMDANTREAVLTAVSSVQPAVPVEFIRNGDLPIGGNDAFRLYDTYGFPVDLTADIARERGLTVDLAGFETAMAKQRERAREASKFVAAGNLPSDLVARLAPTHFDGYESYEADGCKVVAILRNGLPVDQVDAGDEAIIVLDHTPFYAESGGQVGDTGQLVGAEGVVFDVRDTQKLSAVFHGHIGALTQGSLSVGGVLSARVDEARRRAVVLNHSATHLLHAALRTVLGDHVTQKGSLVAPDRLRFDFSHFQPITADELARIEDLVNAEIRGNAEAEVHHMGMQEALDFGAMALFGEKYGERVRVLRMGDFSTELCGGTHVHRTGDIGVFKITSEGGISAGVRRIEAVTGAGALAHLAERESRLAEAARLVGAPEAEIVDKIRQLVERQKKVERELEALKARQASAAVSELADAASDFGDFKLVAARLEGLDAKALREGVDLLKQKLTDAVILLAGTKDGKASLAAGVAGKASASIKAGELVSMVAARIGGKGGGRPDMAQGGGDDGPALLQAIGDVPRWIEEKRA